MVDEIARPRPEFDPVAMEVFSNRLLSITEDMGHSLVRSSFSTNIKERKDCSVGLFDRQGRCLAQAAHMPMHLGSLLGSTLSVLERYPVSEIRPGDVFIGNDVYLASGTHHPDISIVTPVFWEGRLQFFAANVGHHSDVGGSVPGSISGRSRTVFEEGLRIPIVRICRGGELDRDMMYLICQNTREPEDRELDLRAQIATNERGAAMLHAMLRQVGTDEVERSIEALLAYTRRRIRNRIAELPDGDYAFETHMDDDGLDDRPVTIRATVKVSGDRLVIDFAGTSEQARGAVNLPDSALKATCFYAVKVALDPDLPPNSGLFEAIEIQAPPGTIVNPRFPAAAGARSLTANKVAGAVLGAFTEVVPRERVMAASHDCVPTIVFSGQRVNGRGTYVYLETIGGGNGARCDRDGMDGIHVHISNSSNLPAEALEHEYALLVDEYALVDDSGGPGTYRGGMGLARQVRTTEEGVIFSVRADNHIVAPPGIFGGGAGRNARLVRNAGTEREALLDSKVANLVLGKGETIRMETAGGGGSGPPAVRQVESLARDLRDGRISRAVAERDYGVDLVQRALVLQEG